LSCSVTISMFNKPAPEAGFLNITLSCSFKCDQIWGDYSYEYGHSLLSCLSITSILNKPAPEAGFLNISLGLEVALSVTKFVRVIHMSLVTLCCPA
jgi:hypothetical protein